MQPRKLNLEPLERRDAPSSGFSLFDAALSPPLPPLSFEHGHATLPELLPLPSCRGDLEMASRGVLLRFEHGAWTISPYTIEAAALINLPLGASVPLDRYFRDLGLFDADVRLLGVENLITDGVSEFRVLIRVDIDGVNVPLSVRTEAENSGSAHAARFDIDGDGTVTDLDASTLLALLNSRSSDIDPAADLTSADVNGDGELTPLDPLLVINYLIRTEKAAAVPDLCTPPQQPGTESPAQTADADTIIAHTER